MDLAELLRSQARRYKCGACGKSMAGCDINVLAQQGNRALVRVTCTSCQDENLLQIIFHTEGDGDFTGSDDREPLFDEARPEVSHPISSDEIIDLHSFLHSPNASWADLIKPPA